MSKETPKKLHPVDQISLSEFIQYGYIAMATHYISIV